MKPSSTSNSDTRMAGLKVSLKTVIAGVLVFGSIVALFQWFASNVGINDRLIEQLDYLPELAASDSNKKKVIVFGSSMVQFGFEPYVFDGATAERGIETASYNYGKGGLNPEFQEYISRRIREAFEQSGKKLNLTLVEFCPFQATKTRKRETSFISEQNIAIVASDDELWNMTRADLNQGMRLFTIRYLRGGVSAELLTSLPSLLLNNAFVDRPDPDEASIKARRLRTRLGGEFRAARRKDVPDYRSAPWDVALRGGRFDKRKLSPETLEILKKWAASDRYPARMQADLQRRIVGADILNLGFDQELVEAFIRMVQNVQAVSKHVEVILLPQNTDYVKYTPEVQAKLDSVLTEISNKTGVAIKDYQSDPRIGPQHFYDTTHLSLADGIDIFSTMLAEDYAEVLRD